LEEVEGRSRSGPAGCGGSVRAKGNGRERSLRGR
jgi:hypothetical protein